MKKECDCGLPLRWSFTVLSETNKGKLIETFITKHFCHSCGFEETEDPELKITPILKHPTLMEWLK